MPSRPPNAITSDRRAQNRESDERRGSARKRGYTTAWDRYAKTYLRSHPLCRPCEAKHIIRPATLVDHILPVRERPDLFWDETNHQPLCIPCHGEKQSQERREAAQG